MHESIKKCNNIIQQRSTFDGLQYVQLRTTLPLRNITYFFIKWDKKEKYHVNIQFKVYVVV